MNAVKTKRPPEEDPRQMTLGFDGMPSQMQILLEKMTRVERKLDQLTDLDKKMTVLELSEYTGMKAPTIYLYVKQGRIPFKKIGQKLVFSKSEIDRWVEENNRKVTNTAR